MHSHYFWTGRWLTDVESDAVLTAQERPSGTYIPRTVFPTISALSSTTPVVEPGELDSAARRLCGEY